MKRFMCMVLAAALGVACVVQADSKDEARQRRKERHEQIVALVNAGDASEGADGYLVAKAGLESSKVALVKAENADRKIGYEVIAKANGKSVEDVGKKAAEINKARASKKK